MKKPEVIHDRRAEIPAIQAQHTVAAVVRDPYSEIGENITVLRATRDDPLAGMLARQQIDQAQFESGRAWQGLWEAAEVGAMRGIDPTKEPVDGKGAAASPFTDRQREAFNELRMVSLTLGFEGDRLVRQILGERMSLQDVAEQRHKQKKYIGQRFRECLETMAKMWGLAG